jgi:hypothetical protein
MQAGNKFVASNPLCASVRTSEKLKRDSWDGEVALKRQRDKNKSHDSIKFGRSIKQLKQQP